MFNNFFNYGSPFSNPYNAPYYYNQPRYGSRGTNYTDSTDSDDDYYYQPQRNIKTAQGRNLNSRQQQQTQNPISDQKQNIKKNRFFDFLESSSDSESEYENKKVYPTKQQKPTVPQQPKPQPQQKQTQPKQQKQTQQQQPQQTISYEKFFEDPKQIVDGISIECDINENDFPDFYATAKKSRIYSNSQGIADNCLIKLSPLGEIIEKQMQEQQLQACQ